MLQHTRPCLLGNKRAIVFRYPFTCLIHLFNFDGRIFDKSSVSKTGWFTQGAKGAGGQARLLHTRIYKETQPFFTAGNSVRVLQKNPYSSED